MSKIMFLYLFSFQICSNEIKCLKKKIIQYFIEINSYSFDIEIISNKTYFWTFIIIISVTMLFTKEIELKMTFNDLSINLLVNIPHK